jgi:HPt (histidine-containing phosphotransfer) domain-containing protein
MRLKPKGGVSIAFCKNFLNKILTSADKGQGMETQSPITPVQAGAVLTVAADKIADKMADRIADKIMDRELALCRVGGDLGLLKEVAAIFLAEYPKGLADLQGALAAGDAYKFERVAHGLKGSVATFGAQLAVDAAFRLEQLGHAQDLATAMSTLHLLDQHLRVLSLELESI